MSKVALESIYFNEKWGEVLEITITKCKDKQEHIKMKHSSGKAK
jgi:hypothetical protein